MYKSFEPYRTGQSRIKMFVSLVHILYYVVINSTSCMQTKTFMPIISFYFPPLQRTCIFIFCPMLSKTHTESIQFV